MMYNMDCEKYQVLIVDDNEGARAAIRAAIEKVGLPIEIAETDGVEPFKEAMQKSPLPFDLLVVDQRLAVGEEGLECINLARRRFSQTRVVMYTAYPTMENIRSAFKLGADDYISKLADSATVELQAAVKKLLERREERRALRIQREAQVRAEVAYAEHREQWCRQYGNQWLLIRDGAVEKAFPDANELWEDLQRRPAAEQVGYGVVEVKGQEQ
jgi:DNA-binding NtrC family response regulator